MLGVLPRTDESQYDLSCSTAFSLCNGTSKTVDTPDLDPSLRKWKESAAAWIADQGQDGDWSRRAILDPALEQLLPDVAGKSILDLGCGEGRYSRVLQKRGARVVGIDPVLRFVQRARELDPESTYLVASAGEIDLPDQSFDLVLSYLTLVDIPELEPASREVVRLLRPGGRLIVVNISNFASPTEGWVKDLLGRKRYRTVDRYMEHFALDLSWRGINIRNYHRPLSYVLNLFLEQQMVLTQFVEPLPPEDDPEYQDEFRAPNFQIYAFEKLADGGRSE